MPDAMCAEHQYDVMVDLYDGQPREGTRGGLEQFTWDSIKGQALRDRECYLGQSVRVGVQGKFGRFCTNDWWVRKREDPKKLYEEKDVVKRFEELLMQEALGLRPKKLLLIKGDLTEDQKRELLGAEDAESEHLSSVPNDSTNQGATPASAAPPCASSAEARLPNAPSTRRKKDSKKTRKHRHHHRHGDNRPTHKPSKHRRSRSRDSTLSYSKAHRHGSTSYRRSPGSYSRHRQRSSFD